MEIHSALKLIRDAVEEIPLLKKLPHKNSEFPLWVLKVGDILKAAFGKGSDESERFVRAFSSHILRGSQEEFQQEYVDHLSRYEIALKSVLQKYEILGISVVSTTAATGAPPNVFIAHGGESAALDKLCEFLTALGVDAVVVEKMPSEGRSVDQNVAWYLSQADCAIILATKGDIDGKTGDFIPRGNVLIEMGRFQERLPGKVIYLLEEEASLPSNISEKVWQHFTQDNMEQAFIKIARELAVFGLIKAVKGT